jgi:hypothetical protein
LCGSQGVDPFNEFIESVRNAANAIVYVPAAIERDDHFVAIEDDFPYVTCEEETRAQERYSRRQLFKQSAKAPQIWMHQGLAAGQENLLNPQALEIFEERSELLHRNRLAVAIGFPDVAHDAAAVAAAVRHQDNDRYSAQPVSQPVPSQFNCSSQCHVRVSKSSGPA